MFHRFAIAALSAALYAQAPQTEVAPPAFEVASVKANTSLRNGIGNKFGPEMVRWTNAPLEVLIEAAFSLRNYQHVGWPNWFHTDKWDIDAKSAGPATSKQKDQMLQALLIDRFQLKFHREMRDISGYVLTIAKNGPKFHEAKAGAADSASAGTSIATGRIDAHGGEMRSFIFFLSTELGRPVLDNTGLTGKYDIKLEWVPDESQPNSWGELPPADAVGPSIVTAIQDQLGLKVEIKKFPVEMFVIDHVEKIPTAN